MRHFHPTVRIHRREVLRLSVAAATLAAVRSFAANKSDAAINGARAVSATTAATQGSGRVVLVAGATGRTGKRIVSELLSRGHRVKGLARDVAEARLQRPEVEWLAADLKNPDGLESAVRGVDAVIFAVGANAMRDPSNVPEQVEFRGAAALIDRSKNAGVKHFVLMSSGGVGGADPGATTGFAGLLRWKSDAENYLRRSGLAYTIVRPASLTDDDGGVYGIATVQGNPSFVNLPTIARGDVARVLVECLFNANAYRKTFEILNAPTHAPGDWKESFAKLKTD